MEKKKKKSECNSCFIFTAGIHPFSLTILTLQLSLVGLAFIHVSGYIYPIYESHICAVYKWFLRLLKNPTL